MKKKTLIFLSILIILSSCESRQDNKLLGQILGAGLGALVGFQFGSGIGGALSIAGGTIVGGLVGGEIAEYLSEEEELTYSQATKRALDNNPDDYTLISKNKHNPERYAEITPLNSYKLADRDCRDVRQVIGKDGEKHTNISTFCKNPSEEWTLS